MPRVNELGDIEITDAETMHALAEPGRLAILERLQRNGRAGSEQLAADVDTTPEAAIGHLHRLAALGLVSEAGGEWRALGTGIRFEPSEEEDSQVAYRALGTEMFRRVDELPRRWLSETEPVLEPQWRAVSGFVNARTKLTLEEAQALDARMERLLIPYVTRDPDDAPPGARDVRLLRFLMPEVG